MQTSDSIIIIPTYNEKENIEIVLAGVQLKKKCIDFRAMSDKILTRKSKRIDFQEGK